MSASKLNRRELAAMVAAAAALGATSAEAGQPHMEKALQYCSAGLKELKDAAGNKGGHRNKAIEHLEFVIQEIKRGIAYAD
jgi:hypothetical protein